MPTVAEAYALALQHLQSGNLYFAEQLCRQILQVDPRHDAAHHLLGAVAYKKGQYEEAVNHYRQALQHNTESAETHNALGCALDMQGKIDEAVGCYQEAAKLNPRFVAAHNNLATALQRQNMLDEAIRCYRHVLQLDPTYAMAWYNLGNTLTRQENLEEGTRCFHEALRLNPTYADAHNALGGAFQQQHRFDEAIHCFQQALRINSHHVEAHNNLGCAFARQDRFDEAMRCFRQAMQINPQFAEAIFGLGCALEKQDKLEEASQFFDQVLRLRPDYAEAHDAFGTVLFRQGRPDLAVASMGRALCQKPELKTAWSNYLFCLNYDPNSDPQTIFKEHCRWGQRLTIDSGLRTPNSGHPNDPAPQRRLRIGYVSPDFRQHAIVRYFQPVLAHHDAQQVEVFCYAEVPYPDSVTDHLKSLAHHWRSTCRLKDTEVAQTIRDDRIDILVDLAGHTGNSRLSVFALKPAPVQATWLGYMNTTGLTTVDYRLTDELLDPPGQPVRDTEELVRLPRMCCFAPDADGPAVAPLPALKNRHLTFGSLNSLFKINDRVLNLWSRVLEALPPSRLLMFHDKLNAEAQQRLRSQFAKRGIGGERLDLRQGSVAAGYLGIYGEIDVSLDTFPYTGGVTTCESLWMGVPVLTLCGARPASRNSAALLTRVDLTDWIAQTPEEYLALAVALRERLEQLAKLRAELRERAKAALCDARQFTRTLEDAYRTMWQRWCVKQFR